MFGVLVVEILLKGIDLIILHHAGLNGIHVDLHGCSQRCIFVDFFHEPLVLLRFGGVSVGLPAPLFMEHASVSGTDPFRIDKVFSKLGDVVDFNELGVMKNVFLVLVSLLLILDVVLEGDALTV